MKNKKGFTLVELLAVIVLLGVLIAIAVPSVLGISKKIKENMYEAKVKTVEVAAEAWIDDNKNSCKTLKDKNIEFLISAGYLKADDKDGKIRNPVDNSEMNKNTLTTYIDIDKLCQGITTVVNGYNVDRNVVERVNKDIKTYFQNKTFNKSCLSNKGSNPYLLTKVKECINNFNESNFKNLLDDGSTIDDYKVYFQSTPGENPYTVNRYRYEYKIDLYKDGKKYSTKKQYINDDGASERVDIDIPSGYKFDRTTCNRLYYDKGEFIVTTSSTHYTSVACDIYFVPGIATKNY